MALWRQENNINIFNLKKHDSILIKVKALSTKTKVSWEKASVLQIKDYQELEYNNLDIDKKMTFTSPFMIKAL